MNYIKVRDKLDFEVLINILLKNGYKVTAEGTLDDEDGIEIPNADIATYEVSFVE